ncbi:hypothetical protein [Arcticibacter sp. MXS-1]|uniref:hypothetical protein n=1 Tax=Arcticibacter sp. MXS-1 TaxID=3341726 RepID=UPI0035A85513
MGTTVWLWGLEKTAILSLLGLWHQIGNGNSINVRTMNTTINQNLLGQFDKELKAILQNDLKKFRQDKGKFLRNTPGKSQDKDLLVA